MKAIELCGRRIAILCNTEEEYCSVLDSMFRGGLNWHVDYLNKGFVSKGYNIELTGIRNGALYIDCELNSIIYTSINSDSILKSFRLVTVSDFVKDNYSILDIRNRLWNIQK